MANHAAAAKSNGGIGNGGGAGGGGAKGGAGPASNPGAKYNGSGCYAGGAGDVGFTPTANGAAGGVGANGQAFNWYVDGASG